MEKITSFEQANESCRWSLPYSLFMSTEPDSGYLKKCLSRMEKNEFAKLLCKINLFTSSYYVRGFESMFQERCLQNLCRDGVISPQDKSVIDDFFRDSPKRRARHSTFGRPNVLNLLHALLLSEDGVQVSRSESARRRDLFRTLSISSELVALSDIKSRFRESDSWEEMMIYMLPFMRRNAQFGAPTKTPIVYIGRTKLLLVDAFLCKYQEYYDLFQEKFGFEPDTYLKIAAAVIKTMLPRATETIMYSSFQDVYEYSIDEIHLQCSDVDLDSIHKFMVQFSQTIEELASRWKSSRATLDVKPLRNFPILRLPNNKYLVIDELFLCEAIAVGPLFKLLNKNNAKKTIGKFGKSFERYVLLQLEDYHRTTPQDAKPELLWVEQEEDKQNESFDLWISYGDDVVIGEIKSGFLRDEDLIHPDSLVFWKGVRESYVQTSEKKAIGIGQLARSINLLLDNKLDEKFRATEQASIFPVLLVHDQYLASTSFGIFFAGEFWRLMHDQGIPMEGFVEISGKRVYSPIVLAIRDLELYQSIYPKIRISSILRKYSEIDPLRLANIRRVEPTLQFPVEDDSPRICRAAEEIAGKFV